jgi:molybdopterin converting factor subunit 1
MIAVKVKLFAVAKDFAGLGEMVLSLESGSTVSKVIDHLVAQNSAFAEWRSHLRYAVNSEYVDEDYRLEDADEVAIIPPVSGG